MAVTPPPAHVCDAGADYLEGQSLRLTFKQEVEVRQTAMLLLLEKRSEDTPSIYGKEQPGEPTRTDRERLRGEQPGEPTRTDRERLRGELGERPLAVSLAPLYGHRPPPCFSPFSEDHGLASSYTAAGLAARTCHGVHGACYSFLIGFVLA